MELNKFRKAEELQKRINLVRSNLIILIDETDCCGDYRGSFEIIYERKRSNGEKLLKINPTKEEKKEIFSYLISKYSKELIELEIQFVDL